MSLFVFSSSITDPIKYLTIPTKSLPVIIEGVFCLCKKWFLVTFIIVDSLSIVSSFADISISSDYPFDSNHSSVVTEYTESTFQFGWDYAEYWWQFRSCSIIIIDRRISSTHDNWSSFGRKIDLCLCKSFVHWWRWWT